MFTVKQLSSLAGITPRTLHYYDEIGLLKPSEVGDNGYRYYGEDSLLRLQQIMLYREMDVPLERIKGLMGRRDFDIVDALEDHREELEKRIGAVGTPDPNRERYHPAHKRRKENEPQTAF